MDKKLTIFQKLGKVLFGVNDTQTFYIDPKSFENLSDEDLETKKLEAQQALYLQNQWKAISSDANMKAMQFEANRLAQYNDYEQMEYTPEISAALDIFADESTTANENGEILTIYSESNRIKEELTDLFYNILNINTNLPSWARNLCKYGENFIYNKIAPTKGVIGCYQLPNVEITRIDGDFANNLNSMDDGDTTSLFKWDAKQLTFNSFEVSHFRLIGDDRKLPYGTSMLDKARSIWRRLLLLEDAMMVYRITRAPERRVFKIFVGNMDDKDATAYVDKVSQSFKRVTTVNQDGNTGSRYNSVSVDQDFFIPVRDTAQSSPIETLPGASNLSDIGDITYTQNKLLSALRVPKAFLGFEEAAGDGKNLAILDIRFARAVHRVQKSLIQELNKIAIIHLYLKGFEDDLNNFTLSLHSPSTQGEILKLQNEKERVMLYRDAVSDAGNGFGVYSMTYAKKHIMGMSEDEAILDLERQVLEKAGSEEMKALAETIKQTGIFRDIYKTYQINPDNMTGENPKNDGSNDTASDTTFGGGSSFGGGSFDSGIDSGVGDLATDFTSPIDGESEVDDANTEPTENNLDNEPKDDNLSEMILKTNFGSINESISKSIKQINKILK